MRTILHCFILSHEKEQQPDNKFSAVNSHSGHQSSSSSFPFCGEILVETSWKQPANKDAQPSCKMGMAAKSNKTLKNQTSSLEVFTAMMIQLVKQPRQHHANKRSFVFWTSFFEWINFGLAGSASRSQSVCQQTSYIIHMPKTHGMLVVAFLWCCSPLCQPDPVLDACFFFCSHFQAKWVWIVHFIHPPTCKLNSNLCVQQGWCCGLMCTSSQPASCRVLMSDTLFACHGCAK